MTLDHDSQTVFTKLTYENACRIYSIDSKKKIIQILGRLLTNNGFMKFIMGLFFMLNKCTISPY